jgi:hypothetical protein
VHLAAHTADTVRGNDAIDLESDSKKTEQFVNQNEKYRN